jgi:hypothetical protein
MPTATLRRGQGRAISRTRPRGSPDHRHLDLARVLELLLDLAGDLVREQRQRVVVDRAGRDHDPDLAAGLHRVDLVDALVALGDLLELAQALDVRLERLAAGARAARRERVGGLDDDRLDRLRLDLVVVGLHRVGDGLGLAVAAREVAADERVRALDLVRDRLADVVQERGARAVVALAPSSSAIIAARCAHSIEWASTFCRSSCGTSAGRGS